MKRKISILLAIFLAVGAYDAAAQLTDQQIVRYISSAMAQGKSETQIARELMSRGVSTAQLQRLMQTYRSQGGNSPDGRQAAEDLDESSRTRSQAIQGRPSTERTKPGTAAIKGEQQENEYANLFDEDGNKIIYGQDIFSSEKLSFEPNQNAATPEDYVLGPGDELIIDIWGASEVTIKQKISPEGAIVISRVGPVALSGLTINQARGKLKSVLSKTYSTLSNGQSHMTVTLGEVRTIQVSILGEVNAPGTYRLSSFSTVFNALFQAGGITPIGSLRNVRISRGGKEVAKADVYDYIFGGNTGTDAALREGDVIFVPAYETLVGITGFVKRPMFYELKAGESVSALIGYAGGFASGAWTGEVEVERNDGKTNSIFTVKENDFAGFGLADGDMVSAVGNEVEAFANRVSVEGAVRRPGKFQLGGDIATVKQLVEHAGGLLPEAFTGRAQILREKEDRSLEVLSVAIGAVMDGISADIVLRKGDVLIVADKNEIEPKGDFTITGEVVNPGDYKFAENTTVEDLIFMAGGLTEGASSARVDVSRRIADASSTSASDKLAEVFTLSIENGLLDGNSEGFRLQPNDIVSVRKSPSYIEQRNVIISGEVTFPGQYTLMSTNETVSQLLKRAGGATPNGNVKGAMLKRKISTYERNVREEVTKLATQTASKKDSLDTEKLQVEDIYNVGLELDKALKNPGGSYDLVLRDGDELIIPEMASTVRIQGEVLYPNTVQYVSGKSVGYYIRQAGGYTEMARKSKVYVVYMNGTATVGKNSKLEPGCEIIVPTKPEKKGLTTGEWLAIGTSAASLTTMVATIVNLFKK